MPQVSFRLNGRAQVLEAAATLPLLDALREQLQLKGTRFGCGAGECGACAVLLDGRLHSACQTSLGAVQGLEVTTVEGMDAALVDAFIAEQAAQCGYCSSGMLMAAAALLRHTPQPSAAQVVHALNDQLCRCGAHPRIVRAVLRAAAHRPMPSSP